MSEAFRILPSRQLALTHRRILNCFAFRRLGVHDPGLGVGDSLVGSSADDIFAKLGPAANALFSRVKNATPAQLNWPSTPKRTTDPVVEPCSSFLKTSALASALGVASISDYATTTSPPTDIISLKSAAMRNAGFVSCTAEAGFDARAHFVLLPNNGAIIDRIAGGLDSNSSERLGTLPNQTGSEKMVSNCSDNRPACELWFQLGDDAIYVSSGSSDSSAIATAIIDQAR